MHRKNEAETTLSKLIEINPKELKYYYPLAIIQLNTDNLPKSIKTLEKALELQSDNVNFKLYLARAYCMNGDQQKAINTYRDVMKNHPDYEIAWSELASLYYNIDDMKKSLEVRKDAAEKFHYRSYDNYKLATLHHKIGNKKEAVKYYKKAIDCGNGNAYDAASRIAILTGKNYVHKSKKEVAERIPIKYSGKVMIAKAIINGRQGNFIVDTGASITVVSEKFLKKNHMLIKKEYSNMYEIANGDVVNASIGHANFQLGNNAFKSVRVGIIPKFTFDGLIGMDILSRFRLSIEPGSLVLYKQEEKNKV